MVAKVIPYSALVPEPTFWEWVCVTEDEGCGWERGSLGSERMRGIPGIPTCCSFACSPVQVKRAET